MLLNVSYLESAYPITPVEPLKSRFWDNSEICLLFSRKQQQLFSMCIDSIIFGISVLITSIDLLKCEIRI